MAIVLPASDATECSTLYRSMREQEKIEPNAWLQESLLSSFLLALLSSKGRSDNFWCELQVVLWLSCQESAFLINA